MKLPIRYVEQSYIYHGWMIVDSLPADYALTNKNAPGLPVDSGVMATHLLSGAEMSYPGDNQTHQAKVVSFVPSPWTDGTILSGPLGSLEARAHILNIIDGAV